MMRDYLENEKISKLSALTVHHYMKELGLRSIVRKKKRPYVKGEQHKVFPNLLNQEFDVDEANKIWCTDFTYIPRPDGSMRYNCTILDFTVSTIFGTPP